MQVDIRCYLARSFYMSIASWLDQYRIVWPLLHYCSCTRTIFRSPPGRTSTVWPLLHYCSCTRTIFRSPPGRTSTMWLVVWAQDHRNRAHAIIYYSLHLLSTYVGPMSGRDVTWRCWRRINLPGQRKKKQKKKH